MSAPGPEDARLLSRLVAGGVLLLLSLLASVLVAAPARAHTGLVEATPGTGASVAAPDQVVLTFNEELLPSLAVVSVQGPSGAVDLPGAAEVSGRRVVQQLGTLEAGEHRVRYRVVAGDGHPVAGETAFRVEATAARTSATRSAAPTSPPAPAPAPAPTAAAADSGSSTLPVLAGGALLVLGGAALVARRRGAQRPEAADRG